MSYLSPEPLLQSPNWVKRQLENGHQVPAYAYARNNPITNIDPDGLQVPIPIPLPVWPAIPSALPYAATLVAVSPLVAVSAAAASDIGTFPDPGAGTPTGSLDVPIPWTVPMTPAPAIPICRAESLSERCTREYREGIKACQDQLMFGGAGRGGARIACQRCLQVRLAKCMKVGFDPADERFCWSIGM